ncbi:Hypothetical predicted protein [Xyrichtys novacula]|uniref:Uncharacterized protein n=1 Tax=Xyrichtys novacula TaxID=13765 RepID=A0AAV1G4H5_XYRNO|nr:Hypothetical predicted protein [Xyrichtys novacula]
MSVLEDATLNKHLLKNTTKKINLSCLDTFKSQRSAGLVRPHSASPPFAGFTKEEVTAATETHLRISNPQESIFLRRRRRRSLRPLTEDKRRVNRLKTDRQTDVGLTPAAGPYLSNQPQSEMTDEQKHVETKREEEETADSDAAERYDRFSDTLLHAFTSPTVQRENKNPGVLRSSSVCHPGPSLPGRTRVYFPSSCHQQAAISPPPVHRHHQPRQLSSPSGHERSGPSNLQTIRPSN